MDIKLEQKQGFKKTKIGWLPKDWKVMPIKEVFTRVRQPVKVDQDTSYREIGIRSHGKGIFYKKVILGKELGNKSVFWIQPDCLILNIVFAWEQAVAKTTPKEVGFIASHRFPMYKPINDKVELDFILEFFKTPLGKHLLLLASPGGAGRNKTLGQREFSKLLIPIPSLKVQRHIVKTIKFLTRKIEALEQLKDEKLKFKRGMMQLTFKEKVPFLKEKNNEWKEYLMSDVFKRVIRKNKESNNNVLTISAKFGLINQRKFFNKNIASETLTGYYLLQKGEFAYNKSYSKNYSYGAIKRLDKYNKGVVSTLYICFGLIDDKLFSSDFFIHFFESGALNKGLYRITQEGARNHGLLNMAVKDFFNLPILIPHIEEQKEIARFFNMLDREIEIIEEQKKLLAIEKKGIKQNLFSGLSNWITKSELKIEEK